MCSASTLSTPSEIFALTPFFSTIFFLPEFPLSLQAGRPEEGRDLKSSLDKSSPQVPSLFFSPQKTFFVEKRSRRFSEGIREAVQPAFHVI